MAGLVNLIFIITIPFAIASWRLAAYALWPFGRVVGTKPTSGLPSVTGNAGETMRAHGAFHAEYAP